MHTPSGVEVTEQVGPKVSAALRAQASGLGTGSASTLPPSAGSPGHGRARARPGLPAWAVLALAVVLGAMAGGLAGVISTW